jgi:hypothetical protein
MNNTSHITQTLKDKIARLELRRKNIQLYWILGHCGLEASERADLEAKQSKKAEVTSYCYQWQILKSKKSFTVYVKTTKATAKATLKGTTEMTRLRGSPS